MRSNKKDYDPAKDPAFKPPHFYPPTEAERELTPNENIQYLRASLKDLQEAVEKAIKKAYPSGGGSFPVELKDLPFDAIAEIPVAQVLYLSAALKAHKKARAI